MRLDLSMRREGWACLAASRGRVPQAPRTEDDFWREECTGECASVPIAEALEMDQFRSFTASCTTYMFFQGKRRKAWRA